jgi:hypothetical protein
VSRVTRYVNIEEIAVLRARLLAIHIGYVLVILLPDLGVVVLA